MFAPFKSRADVPVIGQPFKVFDVVPVAAAQCLCHPDNVPFVIEGINVSKACLKCRKVYAITSVSYDRALGKPPSVAVSIVDILPEQP